MNCLKQLKAFKFFKDGHVQDIKFRDISVASNYCFVKAKINAHRSHLCVITAWQGKQQHAFFLLCCYDFYCPSLTYVGILINKFASICRLGEACNHVAALLFALENYVKIIDPEDKDIHAYFESHTKRLGLLKVFENLFCPDWTKMSNHPY